MRHYLKLTKCLLFLLVMATSCTDKEFIDEKTSIPMESRAVVEADYPPLGCGNEDDFLARGGLTPPITVRSLSTLPKKIYIYNVYVHIVRGATNNHGVTDDKKDGMVATLINNLHNRFYKHSIYFNPIGSEFIDNDTYDKYNAISAEEIFDVNSHSNAIDIYIFTNVLTSSNPNGVNFGGTGGKSSSIPGTAFWVRLDTYSTTTSSHEMGHVLGLYHTHQGTKLTETIRNPEYVDGTESDRRGDYIIDTPADPGLTDSHGYYAGTNQDVDAHGDVYAPDTTNIMSYYYFRTNFTNWQEAWMRTYIEDEDLNALYLYNGENLIVGSRTVGTNTTYSLNTNILSEYYLLDNWNGTSIKWTVRTEGYTGGSKKLDVTNNYTTESITLTAGSEYHSYKYSIQATITDYRGYTLTTPIKYAYKISNPAQTGALSWSSESRSGNYLGNINLTSPNSSSPIKVHQGGILTFTYTDACGAGSYTDTDIFNFNIYSPSGFTKEAGSNHAFNCEQYLSTTTNGTMMLSFSYPGSSTIMQIPLQVMQGSYAPLKKDSTELEIMEIPDKNEIIVME